MKTVFALMCAVCVASLMGCNKAPESTQTSPLIAAVETYSPLAYARKHKGTVNNQEAVIPPQCYTKTEGKNNPCWACHTNQTPRNHKGDWHLQTVYAFSDLGMTNNWSNLFQDYSEVVASISDEEATHYIRQDNYTPFRQAMAKETHYAGWVPDIDLHAGFDQQGFANDGSWWRSFRYKPFLGTFFPTNGATDDVMIRLPEAFYRDENGQLSKEIYKINLAIIEASMTSGGRLDAPIKRTIEPVDERITGIDLNADGALGQDVTLLTQLPAFYVGQANGYPVKKGLYPKDTEFLHTVRYVDPESDNWLSTRIKEVRYSKKVRESDRWTIARYYEHEDDNKDDELLPLFIGNGVTGLQNDIGWRLQGFIEDQQGRLRAQTDQEHYYCMGCHSNIGVTADQTFGFPRKVPGHSGWGEVNLAGIPDVPQMGHEKPEILTYFERNGGGDEFRNNDEILARFFSEQGVDIEQVSRAAPGGDKDIRHLILPSAERAMALNKAYMALVREQDFEHGREVMLTPPNNVHKEIIDVSAGLSSERIFRDGTLWLDWSGTEFVENSDGR